jgi:hypothetical protein
MDILYPSGYHEWIFCIHLFSLSLSGGHPGLLWIPVNFFNISMMKILDRFWHNRCSYPMQKGKQHNRRSETSFGLIETRKEILK